MTRVLPWANQNRRVRGKVKREEASRLAHLSQPGKINFAWGVRLKLGAFGGQAGTNLEKT